MSTTIYERNGIYVTRLAGPASDGVDRRRWEILAREPVRLTAEQVVALCDLLLVSVSRS